MVVSVLVALPAAGAESAWPLPQAGPVKILEDRHERIYLVFLGSRSNGVVLVAGAELKPVLTGGVLDAAAAPDGWLIYTSGKKIGAISLAGKHTRRKLAASYGGAPSGRGRATCSADGSVWVEGCPKRRGAGGSFADVPASPGGKSTPLALASDTFGNAWTLLDGPKGAAVGVLPAQDASAWQLAPGGIRPGPWRFIAADEFGYVWVAGGRQLKRLDPRSPDKGWIDFGQASALPQSEITTLGLSPAGRAMVGFASGQIFECDMTPDGRKDLRPWSAATDTSPRTGPATSQPLRALLTDSRGRTWVVRGGTLRCTAAPAGAWQRHWKRVAALPGGNHDICGATLGGRFYIAGGRTRAFGFPAKGHWYNEILAYDPAVGAWQVVGKLSHPRAYQGIAALGGKIWMINGLFETGGRAVATKTVECFDPKMRAVTSAPPTRVARPMAVVAAVGGRLYAVGGAEGRRPKGSRIVESIAPGEKAWRQEADAPAAFAAIAGCTHEGRMYIAAPRRGLIVFDPGAGRWTTDLPRPPQMPRSPQVAAYRGEIWLLGGRDLKKQTESFRYSPRTGKWFAGPDLPREMAWGAAGVVGGRLMMTGGAIGRCFSNASYVLRDRPPGRQ